jgi:hypothetical protein
VIRIVYSNTMINGELIQNSYYTIYFLLLHNFFAIIYFSGLILSTALSLYKPSRMATFLMIGFACLLFAFEYDKHIVEGLKEQTINSLITETPRYKLAQAISVMISKILPLLLKFLGWGSLAAAAYLKIKSKKVSQ